MKRKNTFKDLVLKNKSEILQNEKALEKIEEKIDRRHVLK
ncbi:MULTISPECIES: FbpB family small basic protein [unclassified Sporolactobacillus]|nr:FbpB family small basic protein [Sporolactobacillus sp. CQH2019]MDD9149538.1 FbpB family small basic protein [Sporolactobacillus sp. CQH2019]